VPQPRITGVSRPRIPLYTLQAGCDRTTRANARLLTCPGRVIPGWASISPAVTHRPGHRLCRRCPRWQIRTRSVTTCSRPVHSPGENNYQCQKSAKALHIWAGAPGGGRTHTGRILSPLPLPVGLRGRCVQATGHELLGGLDIGSARLHSRLVGADDCAISRYPGPAQRYRRRG
jgi:hypothetical protein